MFTWTSKPTRFLLLALASVTLSGCLSGAEVTRRAPEKVAVADRSVIVAGPPGYCVETAATRETGTGAFVLLGSCASIEGSPRAPRPSVPAVLTASVAAEGAGVAPSPDDLAAFFRSDAGRAALARDGQAGSVRVLDVRKTAEALYIHASDSSDGSVAGLAQDYWRGVFSLGGRLVTVTVVGFADSPLGETVGLATLDAFAARIQAENGVGVSG